MYEEAIGDGGPSNQDDANIQVKKRTLAMDGQIDSQPQPTSAQSLYYVLT